MINVPYDYMNCIIARVNVSCNCMNKCKIMLLNESLSTVTDFMWIEMSQHIPWGHSMLKVNAPLSYF